jgi:3-oxoacyl-[acyl-carrier protein] reductase
MIKFDFNKKLVLVLASSKGIGYELAKKFALNNAKVAICSRSKSNLDKAKKNFSKFIKFKNQVKFFKVNVSNLQELESLHKKIIKSFNCKIDILINNSGGPPSKKIVNTTKADWEHTLNNNLKSFIYMSQIVLKDMKIKKWGRIINLTSSTAKEPAENMVLSNVSRAGVLAFAKTLSKEIKIENITINSILTGAVLTSRLVKLIKKNHGNKIDDVLKKISKSIPVQHIADTEEFVNLILFLCTNEASYVNGTAISIDGGASKTIF